jgi:hypothetical protein
LYGIPLLYFFCAAKVKQSDLNLRYKKSLLLLAESFAYISQKV